MDQQLVRTPCVGLCSTTYGDLICRGCRRTSEEITLWHGFDETEKKDVVNRLDEQLSQVLSSSLIIDDAEKLAQQLQRLQINHDLNRSPWSWLFVLLVKKCDTIEDTSEYGFRVNSDLSLSKLTRESMRQMYQLAGG